MADYLDEIRDRDDRIRQFDYEGTKWGLKASNPYGFWKINMEHGRVPDVLAGQYTSWVQAEQAIVRYTNVSAKEKNDIAGAKAERIEAAIFKKPRDMSKYRQPKKTEETPKEG